jgi:glycosyltransferase involved in cell wall biosynthesis
MTTTMKVAHFLLGRSNPESANGVDKTVYFVCVEQARLGHQVALFSITHLPPIPVPGAEVRVYPPRRLPFRVPVGPHRTLRPRFALRLPRRLVSDLLDWSPDIVHFHSIHIPEAVLLARRLYRDRIPYCVTPNGGLAVEAQRRRWMTKKVFAILFERVYLNRAAFVHAVSQADADGVGRYGVESRVVLARNCIDPEVVPSTLDHELLTRRFPQLHGRRVFLYLGRLDPNHKGLDLLLKAWSQVHGQVQSVLLLVGPDWRGGRARLKALARDLEIGGSVLFAPPVSGPEKWSLLAGAHVFVHPSRWEGAPFSVLEAMLMAKPVLLTEAADPDRLVDHHGAGVVIQADVGSVAIALERFAQLGQEDLASMGISARRLVEREFRWEETAGRLISAYKEALGIRPKR